MEFTWLFTRFQRPMKKKSKSNHVVTLKTRWRYSNQNQYHAWFHLQVDLLVKPTSSNWWSHQSLSTLILVSISLYLSCLSYEKNSEDRYNSFYLVQQVVSTVSFVLSICTGGFHKLYLSYEFFSYDRHDRYDRYNDMETRP